MCDETYLNRGKSDRPDGVRRGRLTVQAGRGEELPEILRPAVEKLVRFSTAYWTLYQTVAGDADRVAVLRKRLGITEDYQHQRFRAIAEHADALLAVKHALPPAVEPLYELALVAKRDDGSKRLREAVERKELTPESGIRQIRQLKKAGEATTKPPVSSGHPTDDAIKITLKGACEEHLADALALLLVTRDELIITVDSQSIIDATKAVLVARYENEALQRQEQLPRAPNVDWDPVLAFDQLMKGTTPGGTIADDVVRNEKHPFHSSLVPSIDRADELKAYAEQNRWLIPEIGLGYDYYAPKLSSQMQRIAKR